MNSLFTYCYMTLSARKIFTSINILCASLSVWSLTDGVIGNLLNKCYRMKRSVIIHDKYLLSPIYIYIYIYMCVCVCVCVCVIRRNMIKCAGRQMI